MMVMHVSPISDFPKFYPQTPLALNPSAELLSTLPQSFFKVLNMGIVLIGGHLAVSFMKWSQECHPSCTKTAEFYMNK